MSSGVSDWSEPTRFKLKYLVSFGSVIRPLSTSLPVRTIESSVTVSGPNPIFSTVKNEHGLFFGLGGLRAGDTVANSTVGLFAGIVTFNCGPPTATANEQLALLPCASVAVQVTVVIPAGKLEPDAGTQITVAPGRLSLTVGGG